MPKLPKKPAAKATDWVAVLRSGATGVAKWNRLTIAQREAAALAGADLSGIDLSGANLSRVKADRANFAGANLTRARLDGAKFAHASFANADLNFANLRVGDATGGDFTGAKLVGAECGQRSFSRASLVGADLTGAQLDDADLRGADFTTATVTDVKWDGAQFDKETKWPAGFAVPGELLWAGRTTDPRLSGRGKNATAADINGLMARLHANIDAKRMQRTLDMLKKGRNQIFSVVEPTLVRGVVRSQKDETRIYSCVLTDDGTYSCGTPDMAQCMGLSNEPCKHLLVLLIGLARAGELNPATADGWVVAANKKNPRWNKTVKNHIADSLLKYKGALAGEIDWRPTETIPEDFYAM